MLVTLRREYAHLVTSGAQLLLLLIALKLESRTGWLVCLSIMAVVSLFAWQSALRRLRSVRDTPTSKIASAAQGYVELTGRGRPFGDPPLLSKFRFLPCLWYRYRIEQRGQKNEWKTVESGESDESFILYDDTGECIVDPEQAEILTQHQEQWVKEGYRYTEWLLIEPDRLYVLGEFRTKGGSNVDFDSRAELNALLAEWKKDMPTLLKRFDLDNNGELDMQEWMLARSAAKREVSRIQRDLQSRPDFHLIGRPADGKLYLISNLPQEKLSRRYLLWSWAHLTIFFGALGGIGWALNTHFMFG